ncbi:MAG TPA: rhodanese-like domain-containing protein [Acidobacteriaceae bacterium]|jgi:rhodanese-related sulfurtransferase
MSLTLIVVLLVGVATGVAVWLKRSRDRRELERDSITPEALYALMKTNPKKVLVFDVRQPLDLLANSEIIPGAKRLAPKDVMANPSLIPRDEDTVVYCTCPSDKTSQEISEKAHAANHLRVKFLRGGLEAWKAQGYPVLPYDEPFHLDTGS